LCKLPYSWANLKEKIINFKLRKMKKTLFTENQIIAMLKQHEQGIKVQDIARTNGISEKTIYRWKSKYGGMDAKELKRV
jgi:putative transposase